MHAELLDDVPEALWTRAMLDKARWTGVELPDMIRIVGAVDPSGTKGDRGITIGIIVAGKCVDRVAYTLADWSCRLSPAAWGRRAVDAYKSGYRPPTSRVARFG